MKIILLQAIIIISSAVFTPAQNQTWIKSDKKDEIETFYQKEQVGTDKYKVLIKVQNNRPKTIKVLVQLQYNAPSGRGDLFWPPIRSNDYICELMIAAGSFGTCKEIVIYTKKVIGVKIIRWDNTESPPSNKSRRNI